MSLLNVIYFPDKVFCLKECGDNALEVLYGLKDGAVYSDYEVIVEGLNGYVANRLREFNIIQEYYRGNRNMSILEKLSSKDISEKLELASVISQYKKNQKIIKELSIEKLPLIQINGKNKSSYYDISDYQYMDEI